MIEELLESFFYDYLLLSRLVKATSVVKGKNEL